MAKLQRWIDLTAALLRRNGSVTLEELVVHVPAYQKHKNKGALRRMFERDKLELRSFGIPIVTENDPASGEATGYRLRRDSFYLPYLSLVQASRTNRRRNPDSYWYRSIPALAFESDELEALVEAARRVEQMGDANLAELARSAMRKLAFDLPVDAAVREVAVYQPRQEELGDMLGALDTALSGRKRATITYHSMSSGTTAPRTVEPFGLFFLGSTWYLAARDGNVVKNFRVSRIADVVVNLQQPGTPDYDIPAAFRLEEHAQSRHAWELGDAAALEVVVEFRGNDGAAIAARRLGDAIARSPSRRKFRVRRTDAFVRWLLSFAGDAVPVTPAAIVEEYQRLATATLARYMD